MEKQARTLMWHNEIEKETLDGFGRHTEGMEMDYRARREALRGYIDGATMKDWAKCWLNKDVCVGHAKSLLDQMGV